MNKYEYSEFYRCMNSIPKLHQKPNYNKFKWHDFDHKLLTKPF